MCFFSCRYLLLLLKIAQNDLSPLLHSTTPAVFACIACSPPQIAGFFFRCTVTTCSAGCLLFFATSFLDNSFIFPIKHSTSRRRLSSGSSSRSRETRLFFLFFFSAAAVADVFICCVRVIVASRSAMWEWWKSLWRKITASGCGYFHSKFFSLHNSEATQNIRWAVQELKEQQKKISQNERLKRTVCVHHAIVSRSWSCKQFFNCNK